MAGLPLKARILRYGVSCFSTFLLRRNGTVNRRLLRLIERAGCLLPTPKYGVVSSDHVVDGARDLWFRVYSPVAGAPSGGLPVMVYFHGGGFTLFSPKTKLIEDFCRRLAGEIPAVVVSVNYRLAPENKYPCQYDDGFDVLSHIDKIDIRDILDKGDPGRCFLAGDSAGGNLAHHVAVRASGSGFNRIWIRGLVSIQPFFGGEKRTESETWLRKDRTLPLRNADFFWKAFLPVGSDRNHPAAHVFGPESENLAGIKYPPTVMFVGGKDPLQDWQRKYGDWLAGSGKEIRVVEYPNMFHWFYVVPELAESSMLVGEIKSFVSGPKSS